MSKASRSRELTLAHRDTQAAIAADVKRKVLHMWGVVDPRNVDAAWPAVSRAIAQVVAEGHATSVDAAAQYLRDHALESGVTLADVVQAPALDADQLETALRVTGPVAVKTASAQGVAPEVAAQIAAIQIAGSTSRLVQSGGRGTVTRTAERHGVGYRRVGSGHSCYFCAMLISRGAVYTSAAAATTSSGTRGTQPQGHKFHDHCNCTVEPLYGHEDEPPEVAAMYARYQEATAGKSGDAAIRAWRQAYEAAAPADAAVVESQILGRDLAGLTDDEVSTLLGTATTDEEVDHVVAELDRRDEVARAEKAAADEKARRKAARDAKREAEQAARDAEFDRRVDAGDDPESAYADVYGVDVHQQRRNEAIASMRSNGYTGRNFDELSRNAFRAYLDESFVAAENATRGALFRGKTRSDRTPAEVDRLFNGSEAYARANASEELLAYWNDHGRLTLEDFRASMLGGELKAKGRQAWY